MIVAGGGVPVGAIGWLYYVGQFLALGLVGVAILRYGLLVTTGFGR